MAPEKISGRIGTRIVGILELVLAITMLSVYFWCVFDFYVTELQESSSCVLFAVFFGIYVLVGVCISAMLILSTFQVIGLNTRKWIAVSWCLFNMGSFIGSVIFMGVSPLFQDITYFLLTIGHLLKLAVFFCIVCTYVWGLSEKIVDMKMYSMSAVRRTRRLKM